MQFVIENSSQNFSHIFGIDNREISKNKITAKFQETSQKQFQPRIHHEIAPASAKNYWLLKKQLFHLMVSHLCRFLNLF